MKRLLTSAAVALATAACSPTPPPAPAPTPPPAATTAPEGEKKPLLTEQQQVHAAAVEALGHVYELNIAESKGNACLVKLDQDDVEAGSNEVRLAWVQPSCREAFPILKRLARWAPTAGGSLSLLDEDNKDLADFSPVQDGTGVYLRGGADKKVYELRTPEW